jgi:hemolysin D
MHDIDVQESNAAKSRAAIANIDAQLRQQREEFARKAATDLSQAEDESGVRSEEVRKSERRRLYQQIRSPVDGTVQQLAVHTVGGVVQPAQALMVIVPDGSDVEVEAQVLNKDIGFVHEGQRVRVKLEAFPFTDYGLVEGRVVTISRDAVQQDPPPGSEGQSKGQAPGLIYAARIRLERNWIGVGGRRQPIGAGLAVQAEIKTGERRIIKYLLSPISQALDEAGRER